MKKLLTLTAAVLSAAMLAACGSSKNIVGTWIDEDSSYQTTYIFNEDGSGSIQMKYSMWQSDDFHYEIKGDSLILSDSTNREEKKFSISGNTLTLDGDTYTRQTN